MTAAQPIIGSGLVTTARTLVIIAVTKSTSRSSSSGNDTTVSENRISDSAAPTALPMARNNSPSLVVSTTVMNSLQAGERGVEPEKQRDQQPHLVHPDHEDEQRDEGHPADLAARSHGGPDRHERDRLPRLAPAAHLVEPDRDERADQRKAGGERIGEIDHAEGGQAEQDRDAAGGIERAEGQPVERHRLKIAQALPQRLRDVGRPQCAAPPDRPCRKSMPSIPPFSFGVLRQGGAAGVLISVNCALGPRLPCGSSRVDSSLPRGYSSTGISRTAASQVDIRTSLK